MTLLPPHGLPFFESETLQSEHEDHPIYFTPLHAEQKLRRVADWCPLDASKIENDQVQVINGCTYGFRVPHLGSKRIDTAFRGSIKRARGIASHSIDVNAPEVPHWFLNTGPSKVEALAFMRLSDETALLFVANSSEEVFIEHESQSRGHLQVWLIPNTTIASHELHEDDSISSTPSSSKKRRRTKENSTSPSGTPKVAKAAEDIAARYLCSWSCESSISKLCVAEFPKRSLLILIDQKGGLRIARVRTDFGTECPVSLEVMMEWPMSPQAGSESLSMRYLSCAADFLCLEDEDIIFSLLAGTSNGSVTSLILRFSPEQNTLSVESSMSVGLSRWGITAVCFLPGTMATLAAAGNAAGSMFLCDLRSERVIVSESEYTSWPINDVAGCSIPGYVAVAQNDAIILSSGSMESSHHSAGRLWHPDAKIRSKGKKAGTEWSDILVPPHRRKMVIRSLDHLCTSCTTVFDTGIWTSDDGSCLVGNVRDLDRKSYGTCGAFCWSLVKPIEAEDDDRIGESAELCERNILMKVRSNVARRSARAAESALKHGVHILGGHFYHLGQFLADHVGVKEYKENQVLPGAYAVRLTASAALWGTKSDLTAYSGALGIVHVFPALVFCRVSV